MTIIETGAVLMKTDTLINSKGKLLEIMKERLLWFLSRFLLIHVIGEGYRRRIGINLVLDSNGDAVVFVIPFFPWLSVYHDFDTSGFYFGWRVYTIQFRVRRNHQGKWFFSSNRGFRRLGKQSLLLSWEEFEDLQETYQKDIYRINIGKYAKFGIKTWEAGSIPTPSKNNEVFMVERAD